jgi:hypothetical protein
MEVEPMGEVEPMEVVGSSNESVGPPNESVEPAIGSDVAAYGTGGAG